MKAAQINSYGDPSVINIVEVDKPVVTEGKVLVEVYASSLNPFDTTVRAGYLKEKLPLNFPVTLGGDIAGVVSEVGPGVTNVVVGDRVYGQANVVAGNSGALAEFAVTSSGQVAKMPQRLGFKQAASLPMVGVAAIEGLTEHISLHAGQKIFIHGGAGGIGTIAIQIAKHLAAYVATTASGENVQYVRDLGADEVIDYKKQDFAELLHDYDAVFDTVGGEDFRKALGILKPGGIAVSMSAQPEDTIAKELGVAAMRQNTKVTTGALDKLSDLVASGAVIPQVGSVFPLEQIKPAFEAFEGKSVRGKIVIEVKG